MLSWESWSSYRQIRKANQNIVLIEILMQFFSVLSLRRNRLFLFSDRFNNKNCNQSATKVWTKALLLYHTWVHPFALEMHLQKAAFNFYCQLLGIAGLDRSFFSPIVSLYKDIFKPINTFSVLRVSIF